MKGKAIIIICAFLVSMSFITNVYTASTPTWWNTSWHYRVEIAVNTTDYSRTNWPVEHEINFTALLQQLNAVGAFDINSTRVVEHNSTGYVLYELTSQFDVYSDYDASTNAAGTIVFLMNGTTSQNTVRHFYIYFDTIENNNKTASNYTLSLHVFGGEKSSM